MVETYTRERLAWEFLRRNSEYQADWRKTRGIAGMIGIVKGDKFPSRWGVSVPPGFFAAPPDPHVDDPGELHLERLLPPWPPWISSSEDWAREHLPMVFDVTLPSKPQLERAKKLIEVYRNIPQVQQWLKQRRPKRAPKELWPCYLRVLDAWAAGATYEEIAEVLGLEESDPAGKAAELLRQARRWTKPERYPKIL